MIVIIKDKIVNLEGFRTIESSEHVSEFEQEYFIRIVYQDNSYIDIAMNDEEDIELNMHRLETKLKDY